MRLCEGTFKGNGGGGGGHMMIVLGQMTYKAPCHTPQCVDVRKKTLSGLFLW